MGHRQIISDISCTNRTACSTIKRSAAIERERRPALMNITVMNAAAAAAMQMISAKSSHIMPYISLYSSIRKTQSAAAHITAFTLLAAHGKNIAQYSSIPAHKRRTA